MRRSAEPVLVARAQAIFNSDLATGSHPTRTVLADAVKHAVRTYGGTRSCAAAVAYAYGDHPETAAPRMYWARTVAHDLDPAGVRGAGW